MKFAMFIFFIILGTGSKTFINKTRQSQIVNDFNIEKNERKNTLLQKS
jgi:hypothetical protein